MTTDGKEVKLKEPEGADFPPGGFAVEDNGYVAPQGRDKEVYIDPASKRLQLLNPFQAACPADFIRLQMYNGSYLYGRTLVAFQGESGKYIRQPAHGSCKWV